MIAGDGVFIPEATGDVTGIRSGDEAVGDGDAVGVREVVDHAEGKQADSRGPRVRQEKMPTDLVAATVLATFSMLWIFPKVKPAPSPP